MQEQHRALYHVAVRVCHTAQRVVPGPCRGGYCGRWVGLGSTAHYTQQHGNVPKEIHYPQLPSTVAVQ